MNPKSMVEAIPQVDTARLIVVHGHPSGVEKAFNTIFDHRKTKIDAPHVYTFLWPEIDFFNESHPSPSTDAYLLESADRAVDGSLNGLSVCATNSRLFMMRILRRVAERAVGVPILVIHVDEDMNLKTGTITGSGNIVLNGHKQTHSTLEQLNGSRRSVEMKELDHLENAQLRFNSY